MTKRTTGHLDEERIMAAIVDAEGLDSAVRRHLLDCSACRAQKKALEAQLGRFGELSRANAPLSLRRPRLPGAESGVFRPTWRIRPTFGMGLALASLLVVLLNPYHLLRPARDPGLEKIYLEMLQDERFMAEVENLEENPLPKFYVDISDTSDSDGPGASHDTKSPGGRDEKATT
ncbi:MAG: hypothetical protein WAW37_14975 [Syntrophobacteraceae bacterium]